jgi:hypothetical protein
MPKADAEKWWLLIKEFGSSLNQAAAEIDCGPSLYCLGPVVVRRGREKRQIVSRTRLPNPAIRKFNSGAAWDLSGKEPMKMRHKMCHKLRRSERLERAGVAAWQHGHRSRRLTMALTIRRRIVAMELGMWRSGRNGGAAGSVTVGKGKLREQLGGTRC